MSLKSLLTTFLIFWQFEPHLLIKNNECSGDLKINEPTKNGEKPFTCSKCESFTKSGDVTILHERTQIGEKPFACSNCDKAFTTDGKLKRYERTHARKAICLPKMWKHLLMMVIWRHMKGSHWRKASCVYNVWQFIYWKWCFVGAEKDPHWREAIWLLKMW